MLSSFSFCSRKEDGVSFPGLAKQGGNKFRTDPFADLSVDEDQVIQGQDYFCCSASPSSEGEPYPAVPPGQSGKTKRESE